MTEFNLQDEIAKDASARIEAINPKGSYIVKAPAGSGKTELLVQRYLALLAKVNEPEEILAVTFTKKAAAQMRQRIVDALLLSKQARPRAEYKILTWQLACAALQKDEQHAWDIIDNPNRLRILTIDSLCGKLVNQLPILSNFGVKSNLATKLKPIYLRAINDFFLYLQEDEGLRKELFVLLTHLDNRVDKLEKLLEDLLYRREHWLPYIASVDDLVEVKRILQKSISNLIVETVNKVLAVFLATDKPSLAEMLEVLAFTGKNLHCSGIENPITEIYPKITDWQLTSTNDLNKYDLVAKQGLCIALAELCLTKADKLRKRLTAKEGFFASTRTGLSQEEKQLNKVMKDKLLANLACLSQSNISYLQQVRNLPAHEYTQAEWEVLSCLIKLLPILVAQLKLVFKEIGLVDFTEVSQAANYALGEFDSPNDLLLSMDYRLQHLLIDEFQDTSFAQFELFEKLVAGFTGFDGRTVFLVGDPMQSIYRFRGAEVGLFIKAWRYGIGEISLQPLELKVNFRSHSSIIKWVNSRFVNILPAKDDIGLSAVSYSSSYAYSSMEFQAESSSSTDSTNNTGSTNNTNDINNIKNHAGVQFFTYKDELLEAQAVVDLVTEQHDLFPEQKIAILVRNRNSLHFILLLLKRYKIEFSAQDLESLANKQIILDLLSLTKAMLHVEDRMAWLSLLRTPWIGLELAEIHTIANFSADSIYHNLLVYEQMDLSQATKDKLAYTLAVLQYWLANRKRQKLSKWVFTLWQALGGYSLAERQQNLVDAQSFFQILDTLEQGAEVQDFHKLEETVKDLYASSVNENSWLSVMTIHKSKGLEFDIVIIPGMHNRLSKEDERLIVWMERARANGVDLLLGVTPQSQTQNSVYQYIRKQDKIKSLLEEQRLLYVAVTRAKYKLYLLGVNKKNTISDINEANMENGQEDTAEIKTAQGSFMDMLRQDFSLADNIDRQKEEQANSAEQVNLAHLPQKLSGELTRISKVDKLNYIPKLQELNAYNQVESSELPVLELNLHKVAWKDVGSLVHRILYELAGSGINSWQTSDKDLLRNNWLVAVRRMGSLNPSKVVEEAEAIVNKAVTQDICKWVLQPHNDASAELALTVLIGGQTAEIVLDRTFIEDGIRWIIDYKLVEHEQDDYAELIANYTPQLEKYAWAFKDRSEKIKLALYFVNTGYWHAWEHNF